MRHNSSVEVPRLQFLRVNNLFLFGLYIPTKTTRTAANTANTTNLPCNFSVQQEDRDTC